MGYMSEWFHDDKAFASIAVLKQDLCKGTKTYWYRENQYPGEAIFIPNPGTGVTEDDGVLMFPVLDGIKRVSFFVMLNATTMEELVDLELPQHIPFTAHGQYVPKVDRDVASAMAVV